MTFLKRNSDAKFLVISDNQRCSHKSPDKKSDVCELAFNGNIGINNLVPVRSTLL